MTDFEMYGHRSYRIGNATTTTLFFDTLDTYPWSEPDEIAKVEALSVGEEALVLLEGAKGKKILTVLRIL